MAHVFISYSKKDRDYARKLADYLITSGFDVWIDDRIDYGDDWWQTVVRAIRECGAFITIMTPDSEQSRWVQRELTIADSEHKPMFPLWLAGGDPLKSDLWAIFARIQYADVQDGELPPSNFMRRLAEAVLPKATLGQNVTPPESPQATTIQTQPR